MKYKGVFQKYIRFSPNWKKIWSPGSYLPKLRDFTLSAMGNIILKIYFRLYKCTFLSYLPKLRDFTISTMGNIILKILDGKTFGFRFFWSLKLVKKDSYRVNYFLVRRTIFEFIFWLIYLILTFISTKKSWCMKSPIDLVWKRKNMWKKLQ